VNARPYKAHISGDIYFAYRILLLQKFLIFYAFCFFPYFPPAEFIGLLLREVLRMLHTNQEIPEAFFEFLKEYSTVILSS
jgi:hypothetical protein